MFPIKVDDSLQGRARDAIKAFESGAYISALSLALALPDICASRLYPNLKCGERYAWWFNEYVSSNYCNEASEENVDSESYFDGDDCYRLRCVFLHEGINALDVSRNKTAYNVAQFRIFRHSEISCDHIGEQTAEGKEMSFRQVDLDLAKFIRAIQAGVDRFARDFPECNERRPIEGPDSVFYNPILDFSNLGDTLCS